MAVRFGYKASAEQFGPVALADYAVAAEEAGFDSVLSAEEKTHVDDPMEMQRLADALPIERAASSWIVGSDPEEHVTRIQHYLDLGFTHLVFHAPGPDQARFIELYGREILPRLRASAGAQRLGAT